MKLIFIFKFDRKILKDLVPMDLLKQLPADDWKKNISAAYHNQGVLGKDDSKIKFLEIIFQWPTFGSAFFEVKVRFKEFSSFLN